MSEKKKRKWWKWLAFVFLFFIIIAIVSPKEENKKANSTTKNRTENNSSVVETNSIKEKSDIKFGLTKEKRKKIFFEIDRALTKASKESIDAFSPWGLKPGRKVQLSKQIPLFYGSNAAVSLPAGTTIEIKKVIKKGNSSYPWYYVSATLPSGNNYEGLINSLALTGQIKYDPKKQQELKEKLVKLYEENIAKKYGLTLKEVKEIEDEGSINGWWLKDKK